MRDKAFPVRKSERIMNAEEKRLEESRKRKVHWKRWGPYLSERQWGTVREDYSPYSTAWEFFPHDHARSRTYRWGEDGIMGICDRHQLICFALAMWNAHDPILKERLFGLTGNEGNHGEDVKEYYFYLDSTPTHSYMKALYKYPQEEFPYTRLLEENRRRNRHDFEHELLDTGVFDENRYFDVFVEHAKASAEDILINITVTNRGPAEADLSILPTIWFRNTWSWGRDDYRPALRAIQQLGIPKEYGIPGSAIIEVEHKAYGKHWLLCEGEPELLFTENETNARKLFGGENRAPYVKDGINDYVVHGKREAVNPDKTGTKASTLYRLRVAPGATATLRLRLTDQEPKIARRSAPRLVIAATPQTELLGQNFDSILAIRRAEADEFYAKRAPTGLSEDTKNVQRQAFAGLQWSKQFYHFDVLTWLDGDPAGPPRNAYGALPIAVSRPSITVSRSSKSWLCARRAEITSGPIARQVGISMVRRVGSSISLHPPGPDRSRFCTRATLPTHVLEDSRLRSSSPFFFVNGTCTPAFLDALPGYLLPDVGSQALLRGRIQQMAAGHH